MFLNRVRMHSLLCTSSLESPYLLESQALTKENDNTEENSDQGPCAQARGGQEGFCMAGPHTPISLACTNPDCEGAAAAERGDATVRDHNGQIIHILHSSTKSPPPCQNAGCVIYDRHKQNKTRLVNLP